MLYAHHVLGRLRVRSRRLKGDREAVLAVCDVLRSISGVSEATGNPSTGSVTIRYQHRQVAFATIWQVLYREGVVGSAVPAFGEGSEEGAARADGDGSTLAEKVIDTVIGAVVGKVLERSALALLAALV
jgi:hypothetical protein